MTGVAWHQVRADTNFVELLDANPWLKSTKLVVKPDMLFGKRGKHDLVGLNLDFSGVEAFIKARMGKVSLPFSDCRGHGMMLDCSEPQHAYGMTVLAGCLACAVVLLSEAYCRSWTWMAVSDQSTPL